MTDRRVKVYLDGDVSNFNRKMLEAAAGAKAFTRELDTSTDRVANLTQSVLALGPALVPIAAAGVPAVAGLSSELGFAAAGAGVAVLAFQGLGKALTAVNAYSVEPTTANLEKMQQTMATLGPAGQDFVLFLQRARPEIQKLQNIAQAGLFPGVEAGLQSLSGLLPDVQHIIGTISTTLGDLGAEAGANLDSPKWHEFIAFLDKEARPTLLAMGRTAGNFAEGLANLWMAFGPVSADFSQSFLGLARDFAKWTDGLDQTKGFQDFISYIDRVGPKVWETLGALANAFVQIVEAAAPVGEATLPVIKALADSIASLANSDLGPAIIGVVALTSAYSRLIALGKVANTGTLGTLFGKSTFGGAAKAAKDLPAASRAYLDFGAALDKTGPKVAGFTSTSARLGASFAASGKLVAGAAGLAFVMSGYADKVGLANTATLALAGSMFGPWGAAVGGGIGLVKDLSAASGDAADKIDALTAQVNAAGPLSQHDRFDIQTTGDSLVKDQKSADASDRLNDALDRNAAAAAKAARAAQDAKFAEAGLTDQMAGASEATRVETAELLRNIDAKNKAADATENAFSAETNYRQALKDAEAQARTNNAGINGSSDAALKNRGSLDQLATAWNRVADAGNATTGDLRKARANFIQVAESMGVSKKAAAALSRELFHIPSPHPKVVLEGIAGALDKIQHVKDRLLSLDGTTAQTFVQIKESTGPKKADGGYITGPGGPRDDKIPAWLSNGEFVVNAAATRRNLGLLHSLNAQKFADGGPVNFSTATLSDSNLKRAIDKWQKALDANTTKLGTLKDQLKSFDDAVRDKFRTNGFNQGDPNTGTGGLAALDSTLILDTAHATRFGIDLKKLKSKGISDGLYNALVESGDLQTADELSALSKSGLNYQDKLFLDRQHATAALGVQAGAGSSIATQIAASNKLNDRLEKTLHSLRAEVKAGAKEGTKAGFATAASSGQHQSTNRPRG